MNINRTFRWRYLCVFASALVIVAGAALVSQSAGPGPLTQAEMARAFGSSEGTGCELTSAIKDCIVDDECTVCLSGAAEEVGVCPTNGKDYAGVSRKECKDDPPANEKNCSEGTLDCYLVDDCVGAGANKNLTCDGPFGNCVSHPSALRFCRKCTAGDPTGHKGTKSDDSCIDCP